MEFLAPRCRFAQRKTRSRRRKIDGGAQTRGASDSEGLRFKARLWRDHGLYMLCAEAATLTLCFSFAARAFGAAALEAKLEFEEEPL